MAAAADSELKAVNFAAYDCGLDVRDVCWSYNEEWFWGCWGCESEVSDV